MDHSQEQSVEGSGWGLPVSRFEVGPGVWLVLPTASIVAAEPSSGPGTTQIGLPGDVLVTAVIDDQIRRPSAMVEWSENQARVFVADRSGQLITQGGVPCTDRYTYACIVGFDGHAGEPLMVGTVGVLIDARFVGLLILWPVADPDLEPDLALVRRLADSVVTDGVGR